MGSLVLARNMFGRKRHCKRLIDEVDNLISIKVLSPFIPNRSSAFSSLMIAELPFVACDDDEVMVPCDSCQHYTGQVPRSPLKVLACRGIQLLREI